MKVIAVIVATLCCLMAAWVVVKHTSPSDAGLSSGANTGAYVTVKGAENTLASLAVEISDPLTFSYDPRTRTALCTKSLIIEGTLRVGDPEDPTFKETLELDTDLCGDLQLDVRPGGELAVYHSNISTASRIITLGACTQGYMLRVEGKLTLVSAGFQYASGSLPESGLHSTAVVDMKESSFTECDGSALRILGVDGSQARIDGCNFSSRGEWGLVADDRGDQPVVIRNSVLDARYGVVLISGGEAALRLVDCDFDKSKIRFTKESGQVEVAWTVDVSVETSAPGPNLEGLRVVATSSDDCGMKEEVIAVTDEHGKARLVLTEWVATPESAKAAAGLNNRTPHIIKVYGSKPEPLAVYEHPVRAAGKGEEVRISLGPRQADAESRAGTDLARSP